MALYSERRALRKDSALINDIEIKGRSRLTEELGRTPSTREIELLVNEVIDARARKYAEASREASARMASGASILRTE